MISMLLLASAQRATHMQYQADTHILSLMHRRTYRTREGMGFDRAPRANSLLGVLLSVYSVHFVAWLRARMLMRMKARGPKDAKHTAPKFDS